MTPGPGTGRPRVAVIGSLGIIGRSQVRMFSTACDVVTYDTGDGREYPAREVSDCDFAVICVGTPESRDGTADLTAVDAAVLDIHAACVRYRSRTVPVLIRSTVPPGTTDKIIGRAAPSWLVCHAPEFMYERPDAEWTDAAEVPFMILGGVPEARKFFAPLLARVFPGEIHECSALEAELIKYTVNLYWASRVTFVNEMAGIAAAYGADWENVRSGWLAHPWVSSQYTGMAGFEPGFGGRCWPKDLSALIAAAQDQGYEAQFLRAIRGANWRFRGGK